MLAGRAPPSWPREAAVGSGQAGVCPARMSSARRPGPVGSGPAAASAAWRPAGSRARARPPRFRSLPRDAARIPSGPLRPQSSFPASDATAVLPRPGPPLAFPPLHPDKRLPGPTVLPGGPSAPSRLQASAPPPSTPSRVVTPRAPIPAGPGTLPHAVASLHSRDSAIKPRLVPSLPTQGRKHTSGIFSLCTRAVRSGSDLRIRAVSFLFSFFFSAPEVAFLTSECSALGGVQAWKADGNVNYIKLQL